MADSALFGEIRVERIAAGARLSWAWDIQVGGRARMLGPLIRALGRRQKRAIWTGLTQFLEGTGATAT